MWKIYYTKQAQKDSKKISNTKLTEKVKLLLDTIKTNPYTPTPPYEKLVGDLKGAYSRRINFQHRLIYQIYDKEKAIKVIRMWTHYE